MKWFEHLCQPFCWSLFISAILLTVRHLMSAEEDGLGLRLHNVWMGFLNRENGTAA